MWLIFILAVPSLSMRDNIEKVVELSFFIRNALPRLHDMVSFHNALPGKVIYLGIFAYRNILGVSDIQSLKLKLIHHTVFEVSTAALTVQLMWRSAVSHSRMILSDHNNVGRAEHLG